MIAMAAGDPVWVGPDGTPLPASDLGDSRVQEGERHYLVVVATFRNENRQVSSVNFCQDWLQCVLDQCAPSLPRMRR